MVEYTRDKILPEDLIQKTNLQQHNFMIDAINDIDGRQGDIEDVTNVIIDDIAILKTNVVTLSNEKLDNLTFDSVPVAGSDNPVKSGGVYNALATKLSAFSLYEHTIRVTSTSGATFGFSLTVLNQSPTTFTLPTLHSYLGGGADDYKECSGVGWFGGDEVDLIGVRAGNPSQLFFQGVNRVTREPDYNGVYDWTQVTVLLTDNVRQIV